MAGLELTKHTRVVAPIEGANVTAPAAQLRANLRHVVFSLGGGLNASRDYGGGLPGGLSIRPDGTVSSTTATYSKLPVDMRLGYVRAPSTTVAFIFGCSGVLIGLLPRILLIMTSER
jgi:hypothetical protein